MFVTDDRNHDKKAIAVFMERVFKILVDYVFLDSSHFKNKYMVNSHFMIFYMRRNSFIRRVQWPLKVKLLIVHCIKLCSSK